MNNFVIVGDFGNVMGFILGATFTAIYFKLKPSFDRHFAELDARFKLTLVAAKSDPFELIAAHGPRWLYVAVTGFTLFLTAFWSGIALLMMIGTGFEPRATVRSEAMANFLTLAIGTPVFYMVFALLIYYLAFVGRLVVAQRNSIAET